MKKIGKEIDILYNKYFLNRYKSFVRKLNINERKGYIFSLIYSLFSFFNLLLIKILSQKMKINFFSIITETGSLIILLSIYRILITSKKFESPRKKIDVKLISNGGLFSFISFITFVGSIYYSSSITNISLIIRFFPFLFLFSENFYQKPISKREIICFSVSFISFILIFLTNVDICDYVGIFLGFLSIFSKYVSSYYWKKNNNSFLDLYLFSFGLLCSGIGGIFMVSLNDKMEKFSFANWIVVFLLGLSIYYSKIFLLKLLKSISNTDKIIAFNLIIIIFSMFADIFIFHIKLNWSLIFILFVVIDSCFFLAELFKSHNKDE